jgi:bifunctional DNase/RNase
MPMPVGPFEASAIILELEGICPPRPLTHDLLAELFKEAGYNLDRVELFGSAGSGARARLRYRRGYRRFGKEVRPSDALALALRLHAPIMAEAEMLAFHRPEQTDSNAFQPKKHIRPAIGDEGPRVLNLEEWRAKTLRA